MYLPVFLVLFVCVRVFDNHTCKHAYFCVCVVYLFVFCLFDFLSVPDSWLPNYLLLLDTGVLICVSTSCRPSHRTFLPSFPRFSECVSVAEDTVVFMLD
jgi:hypothetical protein